MLAELDVPSAFGGSIFNLIPSLRYHITGHFLGETVEGAVQIINKIMTFDPPMQRAKPLPSHYEAALKHFDSTQYLIDFDVRQNRDKANIPFVYLEDTNSRFKRDILAALSLGNITLVTPGFKLAQQLMLNYGISTEMQFKYMHAYNQAAQKRLDADGQLVTDWLGDFESTFGQATGLGLVDDLAYADTRQLGYLQFTVTADAVKGEYVFVSTVKSSSYAASVGRTITVSAAGGVSYA